MTVYEAPLVIRERVVVDVVRSRATCTDWPSLSRSGGREIWCVCKCKIGQEDI